MERVVKALAPAVTLIAERLDRRFHWGRLPRRLGILTLIGLRNRLRERNLYDAGLCPPRAEDRQQIVAPSGYGGAHARRSRHPPDPPRDRRRHHGKDPHRRMDGGAARSSYDRQVVVVLQTGTRASIRPAPFSGPIV